MLCCFDCSGVLLCARLAQLRRGPLAGKRWHHTPLPIRFKRYHGKGVATCLRTRRLRLDLMYGLVLSWHRGSCVGGAELVMSAASYCSTKERRGRHCCTHGAEWARAREDYQVNSRYTCRAPWQVGRHRSALMLGPGDLLRGVKRPYKLAQWCGADAFRGQ